MRIRSLALTSSALSLVFGLTAEAAPALPSGGAVVAGSAKIGAPTTGQLTISQTSNRAVIDWTSFSVGAGGAVRFDQPGASSATLNRVMGGATSSIAGEIEANGSVFLINPNGIEITRSGVVDVGQGFVASTLDIANSDFMAGKGVFAGNGGAVANAGTITTGTGGYVGLLGGAVASSGMIVAPAGQVVIGAARAATLDINGGNFLQVTLPASAALSGDGSTALVSTAAARAAVRGAVNLPGAVDAQAVSGRNGDVTLSGSIAAAGGSITVSAPGEIALQGADLDTSSAAGGGAIRIGGKNGPVQASAVSVDASSFLGANGGVSGSGGSVSLWSTGKTDFAGVISAQGGALGGDGGSAEVSGGVVNYAGTTNLLAANGATGELLIDPFNVTISTGTATGSGFTAGANNTVINATTLDTALKTASVIVSTGASGAQAGTITVSAPLTWSSASSLTLSAASSIAVDAAITSTGAGSLVLRADNTGTGTGTVSFGAGDKVNFGSSTGVVVFYYNPADNPAGSKVEATSYVAPTNYSADVTTNASKSGQFTAYMLVNTVFDLQNIENNLAGDYALGRDINASATTTWNPNSNKTAFGGFLPIEVNGASVFSGALNGQNHTISGLYENWNGAAFGLFGYVGPTGIVENVNLTGISFTFGSNSLFTGVIAGKNQGLIVNDSATGTMSSAIDGVAGGLIGENESTGKITGSHSAVTLTYSGGLSSQGTDFGGLVGQNFGLVDTSFTTGNVTDKADSANVGGLIGLDNGSENGGIVENSYATGVVTGGTSVLGGGANVGGLVGYDLGAAQTKEATPPTPGATGPTLTPGEIFQSYATGAVVDTGAHAFVGGLVGQIDQNGGLLADHATGAVTGGSDGAFGGLAGVSNNGGGVIDSYASGNVTVGVGDEAGGLVGLSAGDGGIVAGWAFGNVTAGAADATNARAAEAGGLVGANETLISGGYALGNVTVGATTSSQQGAIAYAGGLVGNDFAGTLNEVYSVGQVKGGAASLIGGLSGGAGSAVTAGYWDTQISGLTTSAEGSGLTTAQLQGALPSGFGSDSWGVIAGKTFPYLLVQFKSIITGVSEGTPEVVSGTLSGFTSDSGLDVSLRINGVAVAPAAELPSTQTGYYYVLLAPGTIASSGGNKVLVDVNGAANFDDLATGSLTGFNLQAKTLNLVTGAARYSTLETEVDADLAVASSVDGIGKLISDFGIGKTFLSDNNATGFILDRSLNTTGLTIVTAAGDPLTISDEVALSGTGTLDLDAGGALNIDAPIAVTGGGKVLLNFGANGFNFDRGANGFAGSLSFAKGSGEGVAGQALAINATTYKLLFSMADVAAANGTAGHDAVAAPITATIHYGAAVVGSFSGVLEGLGNTISGLNINSAGDDVGLIGTLKAGGQVRDLRLTGATVNGFGGVGELVGANSGTVGNDMASGAVSDPGGGADVGGLVGDNAGTVSGSSASVTVKNSGSGFATGGLVGFDAAGAKVAASSASGAVSGGAKYIGGLIGYNGGTVSIAGSTGAVTAPGATYVGGLVGYNAAGETITDGLTTGATVSAIGGTDVGGLVGINFGTVTGSSASDKVVNNNHGHATGGLVGNNAAGAKLTSSSAAGSVTVGDDVEFAGGLVGYNDGAISDDSATGAVSAAASIYVGGLVGYNFTAGTISNAFATAVAVGGAGSDAVGGLAGYNGGAISNTYAYVGTVSGATYVGGLVADDQGAVSTSWSSGAVIGTSKVGGSIGNHISGTLSDVYWDEGTSGKTVGVGAGVATGLTGIGGATGHSPDAQATYAGFNFTTTWSIDAGTSRPFLKDPAPKTPPN